MKKIYAFMVSMAIAFSMNAQQIQDSIDFLDANQIKAVIGSSGLNFNSVQHDPGYAYPSNSSHKTIYISSLWVGGKCDHQLYLAAERYRDQGRDYYPGPVMDNAFDSIEMPVWNRVWKINKSEIDNHIAHWNDPGYVVPASLASWPAHGNTAHGMNYSQAPFFDSDGDAFYNPAVGDYPLIRGEQAIYFIFNDSADLHYETGGRCMGLEIHGMAYAHTSVPKLQKAIFINFLVYNRSSRIYDSLYIGNFTDIDIGIPWDDFIGCDSSINTYYGYNGSLTDGQYGSNPPVQTVTMLTLPMTSFFYFNNYGTGNGAMKDPSTAEQYYYYMTGRWKDGVHMIYGKNGYPTAPEDTIPCNYMFPGYPNDSMQWNEVNAGNSPFDRRGLGVTGPYTLNPGDYLSFDLAFITIDSGFSKSTGFPNVDNIHGVVTACQHLFDSLYPSSGEDIALGIDRPALHPQSDPVAVVYPNPVMDELNIEVKDEYINSTFEIYNAPGQLVCTGTLLKRTVVNTRNFSPGMYTIKFNINGQSAYQKVIKAGH